MDVRVFPARRLEGIIDPPSSKNYTARYLLAAALADGESLVRFPAQSEDSDALQRCLRELGADLTATADGLRVRGFGRRPFNPGSLNPGNAGAVLRFLLAVCAATLRQVTFLTYYVDSLGKRPHGDLLDALQQMGARIMSRDGRLPITVFGGSLRGGTVQVNGSVSSQYTSALLFAAPLTGEAITIEVTGEIVSRAPIRQTLQVLREAGITVETDGELRRFHIPAGQRYQPREYVVPGDYPGAAAILAAAAITPSDVTMTRLFADEQGERAAVDVLRAMGTHISVEQDRVRVQGGRPLTGGRFDGDAFTDAVPALVAASLFAHGETVFENVENLRYKECDRISDYRAELLKLGAVVAEQPAAILVDGRPDGLPGGVTVSSRVDHRVIMGLSIAALRCAEPVLIRDAHHVAKSYPAFFDDLRRLGVRIDVVQG